MIDFAYKNRFLQGLLPSLEQRTLVLMTGARQTGKTTLAKHQYASLPYINLDSDEHREKIRQLTASTWRTSIGNTVIDEAQKEPSLFEKVKYAYDAGEIDFSVLLGSSQITLLKNIRESLAGRVAIYELYPLVMAELQAFQGQALNKPLLDKLLNGLSLDKILKNVPAVLFDQEETQRLAAQEHLLQWGGMPKLLDLPITERKKWLRDYIAMYLERDLIDLARLNDLQPFRTFQKLAALRSGCLLNYSELARDASLSVDTARRYLEYLKLSYQVVLLQPYYRNLTSTVIKTPKIYWLDIGILKYLTRFEGLITGAIFETMVISEIYKWIKTMQSDVELFFYRTHAGLELDLLMQLPQGLIGIEIKSRKNIVMKDITAMKEISKEVKQDWLGGILIYNGSKIEKIAEPNIWAIPAWRLLTS